MVSDVRSADLSALRFQYFVFAWPGTYDNASKTANDLLGLGCNVQIVSSGSISHARCSVVELDLNAHFGDQFSAALSAFNGDVLVHIQGDAVIDSPTNFVRYAKESFTNSEIGVWSPEVSYTSWPTNLVAVDGSSRHKEISANHHWVVNTDCTCWALRDVVVSDLRSLGVQDMHYGWGIDLLASALAFGRGLYVVRDDRIFVKHPAGTGYSAVEALGEYEQFMSGVPKSVNHVVQLLLSVHRGLVERHNRRLRVRVRRAWKWLYQATGIRLRRIVSR